MELLQREVDSTHTECWVGSLDEIAHEDQRVARVAQLMDAPFVMERARRMVLSIVYCVRTILDAKTPEAQG